MKCRKGTAFVVSGLAACGAQLNTGAMSDNRIYPIEYVAEEAGSPRPVLGFFGDQIYQSYENRSQSERISSESRGALKITTENGAYITDFVPIFAPSKQKTTVDRPAFSCKSAGYGDVYLIACVVAKSARHYRAAYKPGAGILWFEGLCYPDASRTCKYVPLVSSKLLFSPAMIDEFR